jgi:5-methylcytosine-specific restriction endonuclease McrA
MSASDTFDCPDDFAKRLQALRRTRRKKRLALKDVVARKRLSPKERAVIFSKTSGRCHICGGKIEGDWQADHVFSHSLGGQHDVDNYLPSHDNCNNYRWFYGTEEFQWILKLGVWLRTHIEKQTVIGRFAARAFCTYDRRRARRQSTEQG